MDNFRVIISGNSGDGFSCRIEDVYTGERSDVAVFVEHLPGLCSASSIEDLKKKLTKMLTACDKPALVLTRQELKEW